jgi:hypothetical protein
MRVFAISILALAVCAGGCSEEAAPAAPETEQPENGRRMRPQDVFGPVIVEGNIEQLKDPDAQRRIAACNSLGNMYSGGKAAVPALKQVAEKDRDSRVRKAAKEALAKIER